MALDYAGASQLPDGSDNQPGHLNTFLNAAKKGFANEGSMKFPEASLATGYLFSPNIEDSNGPGTAAIDHIDSVLCNPNKPYPVIVGVQGTDKTRFPSHYVLVTSKQVDSAGNVSHTIIDPAIDPANNNDTLEQYGHFETRGYVYGVSILRPPSSAEGATSVLRPETANTAQPSVAPAIGASGDLSQVSINVGDNATIALINPQGN
jgi:hypothetical protein